MMFLSMETYEGLTITANSLVEVTKFLLSEGFEYVLTKRFCEDLIEENFGYQRSRGRRADNPTVHDFGYNDYFSAKKCCTSGEGKRSWKA